MSRQRTREIQQITASVQTHQRTGSGTQKTIHRDFETRRRGIRRRGTKHQKGSTQRCHGSSHDHVVQASATETHEGHESRASWKRIVALGCVEHFRREKNTNLFENFIQNSMLNDFFLFFNRNLAADRRTQFFGDEAR